MQNFEIKLKELKESSKRASKYQQLREFQHQSITGIRKHPQLERDVVIIIIMG